MRIRVASALPLIFAAAAYGSTPHELWTRAAVHTLPVFFEDRGQPGKDYELERFADLMARTSLDAPRPPREWSSLGTTVAFHESGLSHRIILGDCHKHECDHGRARGVGQTHRNTLNTADWDAAPGNIEVQVRLLDQGLRRAYWTCARSGVPWQVGTINAYAGRRCGDSWPG
ncbi:MAG TPA: hypothetical protein VF014_16305, partial [Casimicrobiaceae bacterium]|nr:hypothetical protein [Casimicrobiaceae bacterium]